MEITYDPLGYTPEEKKEVSFFIKPETHARFLIFLRYHDFSVQTVFFESIVNLCLADDEDMFKTIQKIKEESVSLRSRKMASVDYKRGREKRRDFNWDKKELEDIFSIIEEEKGDM